MPSRKSRFTSSLVRALRGVGIVMPRFSLVLAGLTGKASAPFRRVSTREVRGLYPTLSEREAARLLRHVLAMELRSKLLAGFRERNLLALVRGLDLDEAVTPPMILATFHVGPLFALLAALAHFETPVYVMRRLRGSQHGAAELLRGLKALDGGGVVAVPVDPTRAATITVQFFGKPLVLARGAFSLARISGVPVLPVLPVWRGYEASAVFGEKLHAPSGMAVEAAERFLAEGVIRWLEDYLRHHPEDIGIRTLRIFSSRRR